MSDATALVTTVRLWEGRAPLAAGERKEDVPTIAVFRPKKPDGSAIVVCPGGGYHTLAPHEAEPVARWLNTLGVTGIVLTYRHAPKYRHPAPLMDVSRAIRTVRYRAKEWEIDPKRVGVLGFSAGGHLAATVSTLFDSDERAPDEINQLSCRPDLSVLVYPVITFGEISAHTGSRKNLLGDDPQREMFDHLSAEKNVNAHTPPAFILHTVADTVVPVENAILYASALRKATVPFELHCFEPREHGVGLAEKDPVLGAWTRLCATWLASRKFGRGME